MSIKIDYKKRYLRLAQHFSTWSLDPNTKVGCVITDYAHTKMLSYGYNHIPAKLSYKQNELLQNREEKHNAITHAELDAILKLGPTKDTNLRLYIYPILPCLKCMQMLIAFNNIIHIYLPKGHKIRNDLGHNAALRLTKDAGVLISEVEL